MKKINNAIEEFEEAVILDFKNAYEPLYFLKKVPKEDFEKEFNKYMKLLFEKIEANKQDEKILKDIYFALPVLNFELKKEKFFIKQREKLANYFENKNLILDIAQYKFEDSYIYAEYDGMSIFHFLDKYDGNYDVFYHLGENDKEEHFYALQTINKEILDKFKEGNLTIYELFTQKECSYIFVEKDYVYYEFRKIEKSDEKFFSKKVDAIFFMSVWGEPTYTEELNLI